MRDQRFVRKPNAGELAEYVDGILWTRLVGSRPIF